MKKEQIYLDLSKLTQEQIDWVMSVIPKGDSNYEIYGVWKYLIFWGGFQEWEVVYGYQTSTRIEVTFTGFKILCDQWGYTDPIPKPLTELEKECLEMLLKLKQTHNEVELLITKLKSHETI